MPTPQKILAWVTLCWVLSAASAFATDFSRGIVYDVPYDQLTRQFGKMPFSRLTRADSMAIASYRYDGDTLKALAILVDWTNRPGTYSRETIDSLLFSDGVYPPGSMADFYREVSYGLIAVVGDVTDWFTAGTYGDGFDFEAVFPQIDPLVDFSMYDGNHDGNVDAVVFIRAGNGMEDTQDPADIWSYAMSYPPGSGLGPFDGAYIEHWVTVPETRPQRDPSDPHEFSGTDTLNRIGVCAHELGHTLGLPDLYDYDDKLSVASFTTPNDFNDHPMVDYCLMGYGGYGIMALGEKDSRQFCGWSRRQLRWIEPVILDDFIGEIVINCIETTNSNSLYLLPINMAEGEYFLLEYRNSSGAHHFGKTDSDFSVYLWPDLTYGWDPMECGLLITHIDDSLASTTFINNGTPAYPHYSVAVEDAGYNPDRDYSSNPGGRVSDSAMWWYPYEIRKAAPFTSREPGKETFGPQTCPNSEGYDDPTGIFVRVDSLVDDRLYAYVKVPSNDWRVDIDSKTVFTNSPGATVGITAYWTESMTELVIPLVVREQEPGAFWSGALPCDTAGGTPRGVSWNWSNPGWADALQEIRPGIPGVPCAGDGDSGYDGISPDHLVLIARSTGTTSTPPEPSGRKIVTLSFDVGSITGSFEIDTACFTGQFSEITMVDEPSGFNHGPAGPEGEHFMFNKGVINILEANNPEIGVLVPAPNTYDAPATTDVVVVFKDEVQSSTVNNSTMMVCGTQTGPHAGSIQYNEHTQTATFAPLSPFAVGELVTAVLTDGILNMQGVPFTDDYAWSFTIATTKGNGSLSHVADYLPPGAKALAMTAADIDADGDLDFISTNQLTTPPYSYSVVVWRNESAGVFAADGTYSVGNEPFFVTTADFDADGDIDIVTANFTPQTLTFLFNDGTGTFNTQTTHSLPFLPLELVAADFNTDGYPDIAIASSNSLTGDGKVIVKLNRHDGTFPEDVLEYQTISFSYVVQSVCCSDLDNDGDLDLAFSATHCAGVAKNRGAGLFIRSDSLFLGYSLEPKAIRTADFDADGDLDLPVIGATGQDGFLLILQNGGDADFTLSTTKIMDRRILRLAVGDFDRDHDPDFLCTGWSGAYLSYFSNDGGGQIGYRQLPMPDSPQSLYAGDFNQDGGLDVAAVCESPGYVSVLFDCFCPLFCDLDLNGAITPLDVTVLVNFVYRQLDSRRQIDGCLGDNGDWDCNEVVNPVDVAWYINYIYKQLGGGPCDPCEE